MDLTKVSKVTKTTKNIESGTIYFCFKGEKFNGHNYIQEAFDKGAEYVVGSEDHSFDKYIKVDDVNSEMVRVAKLIHNYEKTKLRYIGITGTDGKTSTALLIKNLLNDYSKSAYLGTSGFIIGEQKIDYNGMTTPFADELYANIEIANDRSCENFIMEVSSHALEQQRVLGLSFDIGIFTNLSQDHLDFHKTMDSYYKAKLKLIDQVKNDGKIIINLDDEIIQSIKDDRVISIGMNKNSDFCFSNVVESIDGTSFILEYKSIKYEVNTSLLALFNVYNLVTAFACGVMLGYDLDSLITYVKDYTVEGRMELIKSSENANVILDFAHTPDSINKIMSYINSIKNDGRVFVVTGSAGGRDGSKRPKMGYFAAKYADYLILTEDDPRDESVVTIMSELKSGVDNFECKVEMIANRREALAYVVEVSNKNDIIVLLGKAGQTKMYYDGYETEYIERDEIIKLMNEV
jgi:UDP-N-acetylmuramoyl-L-alanyl-D-glutamate--2,6-diaminopimelate ligase